MVREVIDASDGQRIVLLDSITEATGDDAGRVVISASHGGVSSGRYAARHALGLVLFNDAGIGKDNAGTAALAMLQQLGRAAAVVGHRTARIGEARDHWENGTVSQVNAVAASGGISVGMPVRAAAERWLRRTPVG